MTSEGVFPKINGDILYASEVNKFGPKFIGQVEQSAVANVSGTDYTTLGGTITYGNGVTVPESGICRSFIHVLAGVGKQDAGTDTANMSWRLRISGTAGLNITTTAKTGNVIMGALISHFYTSGAITASGGNIGSSYVLSIEGKSSTDAYTGQVWDFTAIGW